jgi:predicted  nucleic acid-binding Zn-ribbon protein
MPSSVEILRELHRLHKLIRNLEEQIAEGPSVLAAEQARLTKAETDLRDAQDGLKHLKVSVHEKETSLKAAHQQIAKYEKQRDTAGSKKELDAFAHEIAHNRQKVDQLENEIFAGLTEIDERTAKLPEIEKDLVRTRVESANFQKEADERHQRLSRELDRAKTELLETEKGLPEDYRAHYHRMILGHGPEALAAVQDKTCTFCNGSLTMQHMRELEAGRFTMCKGCGRILYV